MAKPKKQKQCTVEGTITNQNGQPIKGVLVRSTDQEFQNDNSYL
jgi:hypothetical protein